MQKLTYYSLVKDDLLKKTLIDGTLKATLGLMLMFFGGPFLVIPALLLIGWGLIPYRKLKKLQFNPNTIQLSNDFLQVDITGKKSKCIPLASIKKMEYIDQGIHFGILIFYDQSTLFAPYFSKRVFNELQEEDLS